MGGGNSPPLGYATVFVPQKFLFLKFLMTSLHVIFRLLPSQSKILASPMHEVRGRHFGPCLPPQITVCVPQSRVNACTSTRGPAKFCPKTGHHKRFSMKQQHRSKKRDQVAWVLRWIYIYIYIFFLVLSSKFESKIYTKGGWHRIWSKIFTRLLPHSECVCLVSAA